MKVAKKFYEICYPKPLNLKVGDLVTVIKSEEKSSEWFGWHFCSDSDGNEGWISDDFINIKDSKGFIINDYTAKELSAEENQRFNILSESYGWWWCSNEDGETGWLPINIF